MSAPVVVLSAGEASGDKLAADFIGEFRRLRPDARLYGVGGGAMAAGGVELIAGNRPLSVMGYWDVLRSLPRILLLRRRLLRFIAGKKPALFIGIDAPDFNLSVAAHARKSGAKAVQYVSPSVWMWRRRRMKKIKNAVDAVWCLFPFEKECYAGAGVAAHYTGHPALARALPARAEARRALDLRDDEQCIVLLPGSRRAELALHLPLFAAAAAKLKTPRRKFVAAAANDEAAALIRAYLPAARLAALDEALAAADAAIVKSGTVTLEAALAGAPMVVVYRLSAPAYWLLRWRRFALPYFSLPNILSRRFVVPELILDEANADLTAAETERLLSDAAAGEAMRRAFAAMRARLQNPPQTAAALAAAMLPAAE